MRKVTAGNGSDSTSAVLAWLQSQQSIHLANLYLIGEPEDPRAIWLTDWESPLKWSCWGIFQPGAIRRNAVSSKIGLEVSSLELEWSPTPADFSANTQTDNPYRLAKNGYYDNWTVRAWTVYMPTAGDADTLGASELFGGRVSEVRVKRGLISLSVTSFLDVVNLELPPNIIELTNTQAAYRGATPPPGASAVPRFNVIAGSTETKLILEETDPDAGHIYSDNVLRNGYVVFDRGGSQTLGRMWAAIYANTVVNISGTDYNEVVIYQPLPWAPTPGVDTCYLSGAAPVDAAEGDYQGFQYVPSPSSAI